MKLDWIRILETAYDLVADDEEWLGSVAGAVRSGLDCELGIVAYFYDAAASRLKLFGYVRAGASEHEIEIARRIHAHPAWRSSALLRETYRSSTALTYSSEMGDERWQDLLAGTGRGGESGPFRVRILHVGDPSHRGCVIGAPDIRATASPLTHKASWTRVAVHLASGLRLRRRLASLGPRSEDGEAILSPSGTLLHAEGPAKSRSARDALRDATLAIDKARGPLRRKDPEAALNLWRGMLEGRWSLIDRFERDGRRLVVAHRNNVATRGLRALTFRERQVVAYVTLGHSNKLIAYELGLSLGSIGTHLSAALGKLGLSSRLELIQIAAKLGASGARVEKREKRGKRDTSSER
jgi:DNA-binding CsgD family transcriptional regulator